MTNDKQYESQAVSTTATANAHALPPAEGVAMPFSDGAFSFFKAPVTNTRPDGVMDLQSVCDYLMGPSAQAATATLRGISDAKARAEYKRNHFDFCTFSGQFAERKSQRQTAASGLLCLDLDHLSGPDASAETAEAQVRELKNLLSTDESLRPRLVFRSPSGDGLKVVVACDLGAGTLLDFFNALSRYMTRAYGVKVDASCKDACRACFLPYDPQPFFRPATGCAPLSRAFLLQTTDPDRQPAPQPFPSRDQTLQQQVEMVVQRIEASATDITPLYEEWRDVAFALNHTFGEAGREWFHRLSQFYPRYDIAETDRQYSACAKAGGITIRSFFAIAKKHGVEVRMPREAEWAAGVSGATRKNDAFSHIKDDAFSYNNIEETESEDTDVAATAGATFARQCQGVLPGLLQAVVSTADTEVEADVLLLGALATLSAALPHLQVRYHKKNLSPHLYLFVAGPASCGKGCLAECRHLLDSIETANENIYNDEWAEYQSQMKLYALDRKNMEEPVKPPRRMLFIPANTSNAAFYKALSDNNGNGLIFETEGDTMANTIKTDFGNYSDLLRKAFHHEPISLYRKTNDEYVNIKSPHLAVVLSGTPAQIASLIPSTENGLFSRFLFYTMPMTEDWLTGFNESDTSIDECFSRLSEDFYRLHSMLRSRYEPLHFRLTETQQKRFDDFFAQRKHTLFHSNETAEDGAVSSLHRMAIITLRIAMVLGALRFLDRGEDPSLPRCTEFFCTEDDFNTALTIATACLDHSDDVNNMLSSARPTGAQQYQLPEERIFSAMPETFTFKTALSLSQTLHIGRSALKRNLKKLELRGLLTHPRRDFYQKACSDSASDAPATGA